MTEKISARRHIVCVDGVSESSGVPNELSKSANSSSILRLKNVIQTGQFMDDQGRTVSQNVQYYQVHAAGNTFERKANLPGEQQIQDIVLELCKQLESPSDEIYLFGSGRGAYTVRAVAGILHHMGVPRPGYLTEFATLYQNTLDLIKARKTDDSLKGGKALEYLRSHTDGAPNIRLVGIFDAIKSPVDKQLHDTSIVTSIRNFRHALAFNENRKTYNLDIPVTPTPKEMQGRSFVQAWFLGYHQDLVGGTQQDGLSIYPLQWIMIEAMRQGLVLSHDGASEENPLALAFPQYTGTAPDISGSEKIQWQIQYSNNMSISMFDPYSIHSARSNSEHSDHSIHFDTIGRLNYFARKIFDEQGLIGYDREQAFGTVLHPSIFCILDRNQRLLEQTRFKSYKENLADFEVNCLRGEAGALPPWLEESQLLASGVKAFRILVCGKTGVGKSTLINKVFGVEMTEESNSYAQGVHDINTAFESPNHPGLLIHDSRGWQAGSDDELELIAQFLRHRAFQKEPAEALHVIWFCVDSDVSRIEEADKRTFATIAQYSNHVPVFVIGTKKDKLVAYRKMQLLEEYMQKTNDYQESNRLANIEADKLAEEQFMALREQLSQIKNYKADGYVCLSKNDQLGVKRLLSQTLDMIVDDRVRLFCVAAQVLDVNKKIDSAVTECMRLGKHAIRTAMVPIPFSGMIGTPTVSRLICEHVLQCFGFPKALPDEVDEIMSRIVLGNLKQFMTVTLTQFTLISSVSIGVAIGTMGIGALLGAGSCLLATPPTARMLLKVACDMILIMERSFRYNGKYVSIKQIEDAAKQYTSIKTTTFGGKEKLLQEHVHDEVDKLVPLAKVMVGFRFQSLRTGFEHIIYKNRFDRASDDDEMDPLSEKLAELEAAIHGPAELPAETERVAELPGTSKVAELEDTQPPPPPHSAELPAEVPESLTTLAHRPSTNKEASELTATTSLISSLKSEPTPSELSSNSSIKGRKPEKSKSDSSSFFSKMSKSMRMKKQKSVA